MKKPENWEVLSSDTFRQILFTASLQDRKMKQMYYDNDNFYKGLYWCWCYDLIGSSGQTGIAIANDWKNNRLRAYIYGDHSALIKDQIYTPLLDRSTNRR